MLTKMKYSTGYYPREIDFVPFSSEAVSKLIPGTLSFRTWCRILRKLAFKMTQGVPPAFAGMTEKRMF
jgi:hypothetical protein